MALRQILLAQQIARLEQQRTDLMTEITSVTARRTAWQAREAAAEAAFGEINENTPQEERDAFDAEAAAIEAEDNEIRADEERTSARLAEIDAEITEKRNALEEIKNRSTPAPASHAAAQNGGNHNMENREFFGMSPERRDAFFAREDVKGWLANVRAIGRTVGQTRTVSGQELLIPEVVLPLIRDSVNKNSKLMKHVNIQRVGGTARQIIMGDIPEAVWTEMCKKLNELNLDFSAAEVDGYKVGGYIAVCNAVLDDSDINLATVIIDALGQAVGYAVDKAIVYGKGTKMPMGFVTRLAQTEAPTDAPANAREWKDLSTSNIQTVPEATGSKLFAAIVKAASAAKAKNGNGKFWVMNEATYGSLMAELITFNSAGAIVSGMNMQMPVVGGQIEILDFVPDNNIGFGYGSKYLLAERAGTAIENSEHVRFIEDQTVFKGTARMDGMPVIEEAFVLMGIHGTAPTTSINFAADLANQ
jgi:HK97 family phage major capsid protein